MPRGKAKIELQTVRSIVRVSPPKFLLMTVCRPKPPYSRKSPKGIVPIQAINKLFLRHFHLGGKIVNKLISNKLIIQINGLHLWSSGKVPNANNGIFVEITDHSELKMNQLKILNNSMQIVKIIRMVKKLFNEIISKIFFNF